MTFQYPNILWALGLITIPVIIHLFNFRRHKKVYFTQVRFLKEIQQETKRQSTIKHWLVLLTRILAITFLVLAFAQPFIPADQNVATQATNRKVVLYVDNSFSMQVKGSDGENFSIAKRKAQEIARGYPNDFQFMLLTNDPYQSSRRWISKTEVIDKIEQAEISSVYREFKNILAPIRAKNDHQHLDVYLLSDFQKSTTDLESIPKDTIQNMFLVPIILNNQQNLYIDSCWLAQPTIHLSGPNKILVRLKSASPSKVRLELKINEVVKAIKETKEIQGNYIDTLNFSLSQAGWNRLTVSLTDYPITFDDQYYIGLFREKKAKILVIEGSESTSYIQQIFSNEPDFNLLLQKENQLDPSSISNSQLIVLNELSSISSGLGDQLKSAVETGKSLFIIPSENLNLESYNAFFAQLKLPPITGISNTTKKVSGINENHVLFDQVFEKIPQNLDLPQVQFFIDQQRSFQTSREAIFTFQDGSSLLSSYTMGSGIVYLLTSSLQPKTNSLVSNALFPPLVYNMGLQASGSIWNAQEIYADNYIQVPVTQDAEHLYTIKGKSIEFIPEHKPIQHRLLLGIHDQIQEAGIYSYASNEDQGYVGFNYNRSESELTFLSPNELEKLAQERGFQIIDQSTMSIRSVVSEITNGKQLWKYSVLLALLFLGVEVLLLRLK